MADDYRQVDQQMKHLNTRHTAVPAGTRLCHGTQLQAGTRLRHLRCAGGVLQTCSWHVSRSALLAAQSANDALPAR